MIIREATQDDGLAIVHMSKRFLELTIYGQLFPYNADAIADLVVRVLEHGAIFVAEEEDGHGAKAIVGMLAVVAIPHPFSGQMFAEEIAWWVEPEARGARVGPGLVRKMLAWAQGRQLGMVKIGAPAESPEVAKYLEHLGFVAVETAYALRF